MGAADIRGWGRDVADFADRAPRDAIELVDQAITERLRADTGGDGAFSRGRALGRADTRVESARNEASVAASGSMAVWGILQGGTRPHDVVAARGGLLRTPYGPRPRVRVSGVAARRTFTDAAQRGLDDATRRLEADWAKVAG